MGWHYRYSLIEWRSDLLTKLVIRNFQRNKKLVLRFEPGINCIVGDNGAGKSSVVRALRWLTLNTPKGVGFIHHDAEEAKVKGWFDGKLVARIRGKRTNAYQLDNEEYVAFGDSVPLPIQRATGMQSVHFQGQLDPLFWVSLKPTALSEEIRQMVDLSLFARCIDYLKQEARQATSEIKAHEIIIDEAGEIIKAGRDLPELEELLTGLDKLYQRLDQTEQAIEEVEVAAIELKSIGKEYYSLEKLEVEIKALSRLEAELGDIEVAINKVEGLSESLDREREQLRKLEQELATYSICKTCGGRYRGKSKNPKSSSDR